MASMPVSFAALLDRPDIWRGDGLSRAGGPTLPCGFPGLDAELPGGGWAAGALTAILPAHEGLGELRRLQIAAEGGRAPAFLFRAPEAASESSPAPLRIALGTSDGGLAVRVLKRRGVPLARPILLPSIPPAARGKTHHVDRHPVAPAAARDFSARLVHA